jgi:hypothetical protein
MSHEMVRYESLADIAMGPRAKSTINLDSFKRTYESLSCEDQSDQLLLRDFHDHVKRDMEDAAIDKTFGIRLLEDGKIVRHDFLQDSVIEGYLITRIHLMIKAHMAYLKVHMAHFVERCKTQINSLANTILTKIPGDNLQSRLQEYVLAFGLELRNYVYVFNFDAIIAASAMETKSNIHPGCVRKEFVYHGSNRASVFAIGHRIRCYTPPQKQFFSLLQPCVEKRCSGMYWSINKHEASTYATPCEDDELRHLACGKLRYEKDKRVEKKENANLDQPVIVQSLVRYGTELAFGSTILVENAAQYVHVTGIISVRPAKAEECAAEISAAVHKGKKFALHVQLLWHFVLLHTHSVLKRKHTQFLDLDKNIQKLQSEDSELQKVAEEYKMLEQEIYNTAPKQGIPRPSNFYDGHDYLWLDHKTMLKPSEVSKLEKLFEKHPKEFAREENWEKIIAMAKAQRLLLSLPTQFWKNLNPRQLTQILLDDEILSHRSIGQPETYHVIVNNFVCLGVPKISNICKVLQTRFGSYVFESYFQLKDMNKHLPVNEILVTSDMDTLFANIVFRASARQQSIQSTPIRWSESPEKWCVRAWADAFKNIFQSMSMDSTLDEASSFPVSNEVAYAWAGNMFYSFARQLCRFRAYQNVVNVKICPEGNIRFLQEYIFPIVPIVYEGTGTHNIERSRHLFQATHQLYLDQLDEMDNKFEFAVPQSFSWYGKMVENILDNKGTGLTSFVEKHPMSFMLVATHDSTLTVEKLRLIVYDTILSLNVMPSDGENCDEDNRRRLRTKSFLEDLRHYLVASMAPDRVSCIFSCMHKSFFRNTRTVCNLPRRDQLQASARMDMLKKLRTDLLYETTKKTWTTTYLCDYVGDSRSGTQFCVKVLDVVSALNEFEFRTPATLCAQTTLAKDTWLLVVDLANRDDEMQSNKFKVQIHRSKDKYMHKKLLTSNERAHYLILKLDQIENYNYIYTKRKHNDTPTNNPEKAKQPKRKE